MQQQRYSNEEITNILAPKWDDSKSQASGQSEVDARRLVVITSYNTAQYQIETIDWEASPARTEFTLKTRDPNT